MVGRPTMVLSIVLYRKNAIAIESEARDSTTRSPPAHPPTLLQAPWLFRQLTRGVSHPGGS